MQYELARWDGGWVSGVTAAGWEDRCASVTAAG